MSDRRRRRDKGKVEVIQPLLIISSSDSDKEKEEVAISSSDSEDNERPTPSAKPSAAKKKVKEEEFELPPGAKLIADCEAADILQGFEARLEILKNLHISIPESFPKSLQYSKDNAVHYTDTKSVKRALERLKEYGATDWEICMIANSCPESCEEAYALIPSLKGKEDTIGDTLNAVLVTLARFKVNDD
ncbi:hypothetical protein KFK09_002272 [Dendrobium nobile]|uniref:RNA polymerase Rpb4/RPC9 core domain-containing protein n=1 Tax=Dendrobium nobile TaxID=94219 RepID=A0A8T3CDB2_DENNO|nr:hypothetical protein KFK09_002272 [Dendrobium nobile]